MSFYSKLRGVLEGVLSEDKLDLLPRSYQIMGKLFLVKLKPELVRSRKRIGKAILGMFPYVDSVIIIKGIREKTRKPDVEVIAGKNSTETIHKEHGCSFLLDVSEIMWSKGNKAERQRVSENVKGVVVDMFAGIGYFSIFLAKSGARKVYSIEINPKSAEFLRKNAWMNGVESKIEILEGDCRKFAKFLKNTADIIVMGYLFETEKYLEAGLEMAKEKCLIHFHRNIHKNEIDEIKDKIKEIVKRKGYKVRFLEIKEVKNYAPNISHCVIDLRIRKS